MKIECLIRRKNGSVVDMGDAMEYHFQPNDLGAHVADVDDETHVATLLAHPEGYRLYNGESPAAAPKSAPAPAKVIDSEPPRTDTGEIDYDALLGDDDRARAVFETVMGRPANPRAGTETVVKHIRKALTPVTPPVETDPVIPDDNTSPLTAAEGDIGGADEDEDGETEQTDAD
jgi:hypothetical protein